MEKIKCLNRYQKGVLSVMVLMALIFGAVYALTIAKVGILYRNTILIPSEENGNRVYSGKIQGKPISFTIMKDKTMIFQEGDKIYEPYTAKWDTTAIPQNQTMPADTQGVELRQGETILFRGGMADYGDFLVLYDENGNLCNVDTIAENNQETDSLQPSVTDVLKLMNKPELVHKGEWFGWFAGVFVCIVNAVLMLFAEELFQWKLSFQIRDGYDVQPSDFEIANRYIVWTAMALFALVLFVVGLQ